MKLSPAMVQPPFPASPRHISRRRDKFWADPLTIHPHESLSLLWKHDLRAIRDQSLLVGVDEAGRGPLAGPVIAAAVALKPEFFRKASHRKNSRGFNDSKQVREPRRRELFAWMEKARRQKRLAFAWAEAGVEEIEQLNIFQATALAMKRAIARLPSEWIPNPPDEELPLFSVQENQCAASKASLILLDGKPMRKLGYPHTPIIKGDSKSLSIAMASIVAKTVRDRIMTDMISIYPQYGFDAHKGYGTSAHLKALEKHGPCEQHRASFLKMLEQTNNTQETFHFA